MGFSQRTFLVNEDDSLLRLPLTRYERLLQRDPEERFPQYAGKRIRYILAVVDLLNRRPVGKGMGGPGRHGKWILVED